MIAYWLLLVCLVIAFGMPLAKVQRRAGSRRAMLPQPTEITLPRSLIGKKGSIARAQEGINSKGNMIDIPVNPLPGVETNGLSDSRVPGLLL